MRKVGQLRELGEGPPPAAPGAAATLSICCGSVAAELTAPIPSFAAAELLEAGHKDGGGSVPVLVTVAGRVGAEHPIASHLGSLRGVILEETASPALPLLGPSCTSTAVAAPLTAATIGNGGAGGAALPQAQRCGVVGAGLRAHALNLTRGPVEDGTGRALVVGARGALGLELTVASEEFEESGRSLVRGTLDYLQGLKMLGVKRVERLLPIGASLTVVGEALKDDRGAVRLQRPQRGPFHVSPKSLDQLIATLGKWSRCYNWLSVACTVLGLYALAAQAVHRLLERRRMAVLHQRVIEAAAGRAASLSLLPRSSQTEEEGTRAAATAPAGAAEAHQSVAADEVKADSGGGGWGAVPPASGVGSNGGVTPDLCVICLEQRYNAVIIPCGHMCCCIGCTSHLSQCPLCRRHIDQVVKAFRH
eukprot:SM000013S26496  [mRNA]  locus=s13:708596:710620:+ [translate_table: standard]